MIYKLSNKAEKNEIEKAFNISLKNPDIYRSKVVINGFDESSLLIITAEEPKKGAIAIWGMLPKFYKDDWNDFQKISNTLNIKKKLLNTNLWFASSFNKRRCLIIVTGFYTTFLNNNHIQQYHISIPKEKPFLLAGIYNTLEDGFITCSVLVRKTDDFTKKYQNIDNYMPIIIPQNLSNFWLDQTTTELALKKLMNKQQKNKLLATALNEDFSTPENMLENFI